MEMTVKCQSVYSEQKGMVHLRENKDTVYTISLNFSVWKSAGGTNSITLKHVVVEVALTCVLHIVP